MDPAQATVIAALLALVGVTVTATAAIVNSLVSTQKNREINHLKTLQDLSVEYDKDLRTRRISSYMELLHKMITLAKYPDADVLTYDSIRTLAFDFRQWYFTSGGFLMSRGSRERMSRGSRDSYFDMQDGFKIVLQKHDCGWLPKGTAGGDRERLMTKLIEQLNVSGSEGREQAREQLREALREYLDRPEGYKVPDDVLDLAIKPLPAGDLVPEDVAFLLRRLVSSLRTEMTTDIESRRGSPLGDARAPLSNKQTTMQE